MTKDEAKQYILFNVKTGEKSQFKGNWEHLGRCCVHWGMRDECSSCEGGRLLIIRYAWGLVRKWQ